MCILQVEQLEIANFLQEHSPFDELPEDALNRLASSVEVAYYRADSDILKFAEPIQDLYVIRSGSVETYRRSGKLYNRLDEGNCFGQMGLMMNRRVRFPVKALEDTLLYCIPVDIYNQFCDEFDDFAEFFGSDENASLRSAVNNQQDANDLTTVKIASLLAREPVTLPTNATVKQAAEVMTEERVSSVLIVDEYKEVEDDTRQLVGIITDRDLRKRVLAVGLPLDTNICEAMSEELMVMDHNAYVFEATLTMLRFNVHHLPIMKKRKPIGVVSLSDIVRHESQSSILFVRGIFTQPSVHDLAQYAKDLPSVFVRMVNEDANSHMIGSAMAVIGRSFKQRLLELAEEELGPPPVPYCFLALGSMARDEQLVVTDQDNALILSNEFDAEQHNEYFARLSKFVSDGLNACGYIYCSGDIMATNPKWRMTLDQWKEQFSEWIEQPNPEALLNSSIFFDLDGVWGRTKWAAKLQSFIADKAQENRLFLSALARNALNRTPPLGFFKGFVMEQDGKHRKSINLKRRGTAPLSDVIRVHALAVASRSQNSFERIQDIMDANILPPGKAQDMSDALEYISMVRIRHQALTIEAGEEPDNNIEPDKLSSFERRNLKEAFQVLDKAQSFLKFCYHSQNRPR
ncbi:DUF294 nucleotidyltransferase-like domain-containing protein [Bermanella marisrubri]|uniref:DUF294 nucleotidyltransferase-like domain-containing protein n=1 Tax=Bermanella marisrubri TaxID=207949 RepID=UPI00311D7277